MKLLWMVVWRAVAYSALSMLVAIGTALVRHKPLDFESARGTITLILLCDLLARLKLVCGMSKINKP